MTFSRRIKIDLIVLTLVLLLAALAVPNAQAIGDRWHALRYSPPTEVVQLADDAGMNEQGRRYFYRLSPQIVDAETLENQCGPKLGCVEGTNMYILSWRSPAEYNRAVVTAAHEMLHVAYDRLDEMTKKMLASQLDAEIQNKEALSEAILQYKHVPDTYYDEAHAYAGSEVGGLNDALEAHYRTYFDDRAKTLTAYQQSPEG